jgi:hypothetical protein
VSIVQDLTQCQKQHGFSMVQLRLTFMRGLHPFYPPAVEIVRPHFTGPTLGVLAAHPMLQLSNWDPWKAQTAVLSELKHFLQASSQPLHLLLPTHTPHSHGRSQHKA